MIPIFNFQRVVHQRVLPALSGEFRNHKMIPFVLPLLLLIAEDCSIQEYSTLVLPVLIPALGVQDPVQVRNMSMSRVWTNILIRYTV